AAGSPAGWLPAVASNACLPGSVEQVVCTCQSMTPPRRTSLAKKNRRTVAHPAVFVTACRSDGRCLFLFSGAFLGCRRADQVIKRRQRRLGTLAHGDDDLLVRRRGAVTGGEHARDIGLATGIHLDLATVAQ